MAERQQTVGMHTELHLLTWNSPGQLGRLDAWRCEKAEHQSGWCNCPRNGPQAVSKVWR